jgi:hypothetical protein
MPYTKTSWTSGTTPVDAPEMNNLEKQYDEAVNSLPSVFSGAFVIDGCTGVRNGGNLKQLNFTGGDAFVMQTDGSFRIRSPITQNFLTSVASTTYFLDLNPDGTLSWGTSHSGVSNFLPLLQLTTDGSANIVTPITDNRQLYVNLFPNAVGSLKFGGAVIPEVQWPTSGSSSQAPTLYIQQSTPGSPKKYDVWIKLPFA